MMPLLTTAFLTVLLPFSCVGPQIMLYKTLNLHMARPYQKRAAGVAMLNGIGGLSNIWSSYLWYDAPRYYAAFGCRKCSTPSDYLLPLLSRFY